MSFEKQSVFWICLFLVVATAGVYWQVMNFDFVDFDDHKYVPENSMVQQGLTPDSIRWAFTSEHASNWFPLTWLSLMLDRQLFGPDAGAFHRTNLLLHIANTLLLFFVLNNCTKARWPGFFVALAFGLHPLHVESVAWITERKDVLSTLFWMLTMLTYVRYCRCRRTKIVWYALALAFMGLGLMAKPMLVTLPCVLLLLDYWPLGRMNFAVSTGNNDSRPDYYAGISETRSLAFLVLEKIPFFILSAASSVVTLIVQKQTRAPIMLLSLKARVANALVSYVSYIGKMFWPKNLAAFYPHPGSTLPIWQVIIALVVLFCISVLVIRCGRRAPYIIVGWLWYLGTLLPVIGLVQVGTQAMADRYTYIPLVGLFIIIAWAVYDVVVRRRYCGIIFAGMTFVVCIPLMICTFRQVGYWRNSSTLFERAIKVTSKNYVAHTGLGVAFAQAGDIEKAVRHFNAALGIKPGHIDAHFNLGKVLAEQGKVSEAVECYNKVLSLNPGHADAYNSLALLLAGHGRLDEAVALYRRGLESNPEDVPLHSNLGVALIQQGKFDEAVREFRVVLQLRPDSGTHKNLAVALTFKGEFDEAIKHYTESVRLEPANAHTHYLLGNALLAQGKTAAAIAEYRTALELDPQHERAKTALEEAVAGATRSSRY
jgi:tetratricopeptide (TPR) repeat protein